MTDSTPLPRSHRFGIPVGIAVLAATVLVVLRMQAEMDSNMKNLWSIASVALAVLLTLVWFLFLSRFAIWARIVGLFLIAGLVAGIKNLTRVEGAVDGSGRPNIVWKWAPRHEVPALPDKAKNSTPQARTDIPDVPQFFGPNRDGVVHDARLDHDWAAHPPKLRWRQPSGLGWASFAVVGGRAFTLEQRGEDELVTCYDAPTGALVWSHVHPKTRFVEWQGGDGPRTTPTISNGKVYALGATGVLDCLNLNDGSLVWTRNVLEGQPKNLMWGKSSSPLVYGDKVVVTGGDYGKDGHGGCVLAFNRDTGSPLWQSGDDNSSYASPILTTLAGIRVVLSSNANNLSAHDAATGRMLLKHPWGVPQWPRAAQPLVLPGDRVFLSAGYGNGCLMLKIQAGVDGMLTATELWSNKKMKMQFNSPHLLNGHIYGLDDGALACMNAETGERLWKDGRFGSGQSLLVDDAVLVQSEKGDVILAAAKPDAYQELGRIPALSSKTWNHPVVAGRYLLVRNDQEMACYELAVK